MIPMDPCSEATSMGMKNPAQTGQGTNELILDFFDWLNAVAVENDFRIYLFAVGHKIQLPAVTLQI